jgi:archaellum biogenesis ATPase FlaH
MGRAEAEKLLVEKRAESKLAVIDLISPLLVQHNPKNVSFWLSEFVQKLKALNFTTISTINPKMHGPDELAIIASAFDGEIELVADASGSHSVVVRRYTDHKYETKPIKL